MKELITKSLKQIQSGAFNTGGAIIFAIIILAFIVIGLGLIPALFIWGLQMMGFAIPLTFKSWCGSAIVLFVIRTRFTSGTKNKE
jgi:membrane protein implicated in regulation of membrane protease activity